jgi:nucleoside-diphosphate-sugar epimerase
VDVRDLAAFALRTAEHGICGAYNIAAPIGGETFGGMLRACAEVTGSDAEFVWVPDAELLAQGIRQWSEMPLWRTFSGVWNVDPGATLAAGLSCRPLAATVAGTWSWLRSSGEAQDNERASEIGLSREREEQILARVS